MEWSGSVGEKAKYCDSGEYLAVSSGGDGRLRIWDTGTSTLKQEFVSSTHLTATCTALEWSPSIQISRKKKKQKKVIEEGVVVMGTAVGSLVFYSLAKAQLLAHTEEAHSGHVTGLAWDPVNLSLYSCGADGYIVEWDPETTKVVSRWKASKSSLNCIRVFNSSSKSYLLSAGINITLWDLETKTSDSSYYGHPSGVHQLELVPDTDYFVTLSYTDRYIRVWTKSDKNAVATLALTNVPARFQVMSSSSPSSSIFLSVVTQDGVLNLFQQKLNGPVRKPQQPTCIFSFSDAHTNERIPLLASHLLPETITEDSKLAVSFGSWLRIQCEKLPLKGLEGEISLKRDVFQKKKSKKSKQTLEAEVTRESVPLTVKHLQPGVDNSVKPEKAKKRKKGDEKVEEGELPMEERLSNLTLERPAGSSVSVPDGRNLAHLLSQGLHSKDARILQSVLSVWDEEIIGNTVRSIPVQLVVPLLTEIKSRLGGKAPVTHSLVKWLKSIFQVHSAFLMSCSSTDDLLGPFMSLLKMRETLYPQMCQLRGKLELIKGNIKAKEYKAVTPNEALLVYNDESSEDEMDQDDLIPSESEELMDSDDLGIDDDDDSEEDEEGESSNENSAASSESDESADENDSKKKLTNNHKNQAPASDDDDYEDMED